MRKFSLYAQPNTSLIPNFWDILAFSLVCIIVTSLTWAGSHMTLPFHIGQQISISLDPKHLPLYALQTTVRMLVALFFSFVFSLGVGALAAKNKQAEKILIPLIDILQSVPVLGYLAISFPALIALFPGSRLGPECAAIFVVFTAQVWNMTLSFYQSLKMIPVELDEVANVYQLSTWQKFWRLETPFAIPGLLWNAMMSMSAGWFFIVASESISIANQQVTLPGIGSYIALAITHSNLQAIGYAIATMLVVIILYDQLFFRPLIAWSEKFRLTDIPEQSAGSWVLKLLARTRLLQHFGDKVEQFGNAIVNFPPFSKKGFVHKPKKPIENSVWRLIAQYGGMVILGALFASMLWHLVFKHISYTITWHVALLGAYTAIRVFILILLCSLIWVPIGVWIGMRPRAAKIAQPIAQILAAFPANLFFRLVVILILRYQLNVEIWTAPLMILGTQWYILFNVIAGASSIPKELKLAAKNMQLRGFLKWRRFYLPAIFPFFVTGAITAAGGAWNASIVAEYVTWGKTTLIAHGLGAYIQQKTIAGNFPEIALGVIMMCLWVTLINMLFWRKLYKFAENRYKFS